MKIVFIIGNGFDIDLGWKTQFSEFSKSDYWPKRMEPYSRLQEAVHSSGVLQSQIGLTIRVRWQTMQIRRIAQQCLYTRKTILSISTFCLSP